MRVETGGLALGSRNAPPPGLSWVVVFRRIFVINEGHEVDRINGTAAALPPLGKAPISNADDWHVPPFN